MDANFRSPATEPTPTASRSSARHSDPIPTPVTAVASRCAATFRQIALEPGFRCPKAYRAAHPNHENALAQARDRAIEGPGAGDQVPATPWSRCGSTAPPPTPAHPSRQAQPPMHRAAGWSGGGGWWRPGAPQRWVAVAWRGCAGCSAAPARMSWQPRHSCSTVARPRPAHRELHSRNAQGGC